MDSDDLLNDLDFERTVIGQNASSLLEKAFGLRLKSPVAELPLQLSPILIGRDATCVLQLPSRMVSRHHAIIYKAGKNHIVRDLHSTNGVVQNGERVKRAVIRSGDTLQMGDQKLFLVQGPPVYQDYLEECVVVFLDLENSTSLSEKYGEAFSKEMDHQLQLLEDQVLINMGCPVKNLGDGLMCAFGLWPVDQPNYNPVDQAVRFAWQAVRQFRRIPNYPPLRLRVGLHWGNVVVTDSSDIDLFGDTVNVAARLENANKQYGTQIMVSKEIWSRTRLAPCLREVDTVRVQGKDEPMNVYVWDEVFVETRANQHRAHYEAGLKAYREGHFGAALEHLNMGVESGDLLCEQLRDRIQSMDGVPENWDGVFSITK